MTQKPRAAKPAEAKAVWDSLKAEGREPSSQLVVTALMASGKFLPINRSTITRWRKSGWKISKTGRKTPMEEAGAQLSAAVSAITGDETTRTADIVAQESSAPKAKGDDESAPPAGDTGPQYTYAELALKATYDLRGLAIRHGYIEQILVRQALRPLIPAMVKLATDDEGKPVVVLDPALGDMSKALGGSLVATTRADSTLSASGSKTIDGSLAPSEDPLSDVWEAIDKELAASK
jgi:hypothetical protein